MVKNRIRLLLIVVFGLALSRSMPIDAVLAQSARPIYFMIFDEKATPQLLVREPNGRVRPVFEEHNDGFFDSVSPDGNLITFERWNYASYKSESVTYWLADLRSNAQWVIDSSPATGQIRSRWSGNGRYLLLTEQGAVTPLWAGYNYGFKSVYDTINKSLTHLQDLVGFMEGWYPDNQHILAWRQGVGYFKYNIADQ